MNASRAGNAGKGRNVLPSRRRSRAWKPWPWLQNGWSWLSSWKIVNVTARETGFAAKQNVSWGTFLRCNGILSTGPRSDISANISVKLLTAQIPRPFDWEHCCYPRCWSSNWRSVFKLKWFEGISIMWKCAKTMSLTHMVFKVVFFFGNAKSAHNQTSWKKSYKVQPKKSLQDHPRHINKYGETSRRSQWYLPGRHVCQHIWVFWLQADSKGLEPWQSVNILIYISETTQE